VRDTNVAWILRADAAFNFLAGLVALFFYRPAVALIGWPDTETPIYANVLGAALIGLSPAVWSAANRPEQSRGTILASIVAKVLAGAAVLYWVFIARIELPSPWLLPTAVGAQVLFVLGEATYLYRRPKQAATRSHRSDGEHD
jgi:hypothetical protein